MLLSLFNGRTYWRRMIYINDIVFSATFPEHLEQLTRVLLKLYNPGLKLNTEKCNFAQKAVKKLGHVSIS